jgi:hypothetical protein
MCTKAGLDLATRPLLPKHDGTTLVVAHNEERVFADIDADHGDCALEFLRHGVLLVFWRPLPSSLAGGAGARPDHPISRRAASAERRIMSARVETKAAINAAITT